MNTAVLIASRELRDRARLFLIAASLSIIPFAAALALREHRQMGIATTAAFLAAAYASALALAFGVGTIGRELTEKRLSFFLAKPVSASAIWIGKAAAGLLTAAGAAVVVILPSYLFANAGWRELWAASGPIFAICTSLNIVVLFFVGHAASTMLRSRSALVAADFVLLAAMLTAILAMTRPLLLGGGRDLVLTLLTVIGAALLVLLAVAPIWQLARGRIEPRRNHAAFSLVLWSGTAVVVAVAGGYALWVISAPLSSLTQIYNVAQSPAGRWLSVSGQTANRGEYQASFLVDGATGARERVAVAPWSTVHISRDGKTAVWMESDELIPRNGTLRLYTRRLEPGAKQIATPLVIGMPREVVLTDDGSRLAITSRDKIEVYEVSTGRLLGATTGVNPGAIRRMFFAGPDVVLLLEIVQGSNPTLRIREFDVSRRKLTTTAERPVPRTPMVQVARDGSRLYLRQDAVVLDPHTGKVLATLPVKPVRPFFGAMLSDGSIVVTRDSKLHHFAPHGTLVAEIPIPVQQAGVVGQVGGSKVVLSVGANNTSDWRMLIVDLSSHKVVAIPGVRSALTWWSDPALPMFTEDAAIAAMDEQRKPVLVDARTGARRPFPS